MSESENESVGSVVKVISSEGSGFEDDYGIINLEGAVRPYQGEPFANLEDAEAYEQDEEDPDQIPMDVLGARYERRIPVNEWCQCNKCDSALLDGAREYQCCFEIPAAIDKLGGEIQVTRCITQQEDCLSMAKRWPTT
eukprot:gene10086-18737_t